MDRGLTGEQFERIFREYYGPLVRFAGVILRTGNISDAEEVVQDVMSALWEKHQKLDVHTSIKSYLFTSVRNTSLMRIRHDKIAVASEKLLESDEAPVMAQGEPAIDRSLEQRELSIALDAMIDSLPEHQRSACILRWRQEMSYKEIGAVLGLSPDAVRVQIDRVEKKLATLLGPYR